MDGSLLLIIGSVVITLWGIAHVIPTKSVVAGFGTISDDNRRIITMEWIAEGLTLCFIGVVVFFCTIFEGRHTVTGTTVYRLSAGMLFVMAVLSLFTGARTKVLPMRLCPIVKTIVAGLFIYGSFA